MRYFINIVETRIIPPTRNSEGNCVIFSVRRMNSLISLLGRFESLRGIVYNDYIDLWDASKATHHAYENEFGQGGGRIMISNNKTIEYNIHDFSDDDDDEILAEKKLLSYPVMEKIFLSDIENWEIYSNEI